LNPYTRALLSAIPTIQEQDRERVPLQGEPPDPGDPPPGCRFHPRCPLAQAVCKQQAPPLQEWLPGHWAACHFALADTGAISEAESTKEINP
jgi:oligopeptide/dipeptide ABC transporter ATP-binding protein